MYLKFINQETKKLEYSYFNEINQFKVGEVINFAINNIPPNAIEYETIISDKWEVKSISHDIKATYFNGCYSKDHYYHSVEILISKL